VSIVYIMLNQNLRFFYASLVGLLSGFIGGLIGLTGSILIIPLILIFGIFNDYRSSIGTVLFSFDPILSIFAILEYAKQNKIEYVMGIIIMFSYMFGSYIGSKMNKYFSEINIKYINATILLILSIYMFYNAIQNK
jgi:uncharacterized membrane protein YfcA